MFVVAALLSPPAAGYGAPYPRARLASAPEHHGCYVRYQLSTNDPIGRVANFYRSEAAQAGVSLLNDTNKFADYRMMVFVTQPNFLDVVMDRKDGQTHVRVSYEVRNSTACRSS